MAVLDFLKKGKNTKADIANNFLSLTITPEKVIAHIWNFDDQENVKTVGVGEKSFTNSSVLIHETAIAIDNAGEKSNADISKVVFGLSQNWLQENNLSDETADMLKQLTDDLELEAQAFISLASAANHYYKVEESITPHAVLLGIFPKLLEVHLIENNKVQKTLSEETEPTLQKIESQIKALAQDGRVLPSKIVIYGKKPDDKICREVEKHIWNTIFIHPPKIEYISEEDLSRSVSYAQAADILGHEPLKIKSENQIAQTSSEEAQNGSVKAQHKLDSLGFIEGEDVLSLPEEDMPSEAVEVLSGGLDENISPVPVFNPQMENTPKTSKRRFPLEGIIEKISSLSWLPSVSFIHGKSKRTIALVAAVALVVLLVAAFVAVESIKTTTVEVKVNSQDYNNSFSAKVLTSGSPDIMNTQIQGHLITTNQSDSQKAVVTGTKNVGQQAKGQVNVLNWTTSPKTFPQGSTLITKDGIKFTTDSDVTVASRSATTPGENPVNITASDFGENGNVGANTDFTFSQYDELLFSARNDNAFSGGNEKQVTVVSQDDLDKLKKSLTDKLKQKAKDQLTQQAGGQNITDSSISLTITKSTFDKKVDDEASFVNLDMSVTASAITYNQDDLKNMLSKSAQNIPQGYKIQQDQINLSGLTQTINDDSLKISGDYSAKLVPDLNVDTLKSQISGKNQKDATEIIKQNPNVQDVNFTFSPAIPIFSSLPKNSSKINIKLST